MSEYNLKVALLIVFLIVNLVIMEMDVMSVMMAVCSHL